MIVRHIATRAMAMAALAAAIVAFTAPAGAQSMSLSDRVTRLEQQAGARNGSGGNAVELVNQISALQSQVQSLQGQIEELKHALDESKQRNKDQYIDLDSRIGRLEGRAGTAPPPAAAAAPARAGSSQPPDIDLGSPANRPPPPASAAPSGEANGDLTPQDQAAVAPGESDDAADDNGAPADAPDPAAAMTAYNSAFDALKNAHYAESARRFQSFIDQYPNHELTGNAYYWLGESYYVTQNYDVAEKAFQTLLQRFPNSQKSPDALLKVGYCQYGLKQWDQAQSTLNQVVQSYPGTTVARLAQGRLRAMKLETHP